jgi:hypothetical protein
MRWRLIVVDVATAASDASAEQLMASHRVRHRRDIASVLIIGEGIERVAESIV